MTEFDVDTWTAERDGVTYEFGLYSDESANNQPLEYIAADDEGLSPSDLAAFEAGDWRYVVVTVTPLVDGEPVTAARVHAEQIPWGYMPAETEPWQGGMHGELNAGNRASVEADPGAELMDEARAELVKFRDQLNALPL